jgi:hypothetical protein
MHYYLRGLDSRDIELGRQVTDALELTNLPVEGSLWFQRADSEEWRLVLATPLVDTQGPQAAYSKFYRAIKRLNLEHELPLWRVTVVSPKEPLIMSLRSALKPRGSSTLRSFRINQFFKDTYIYYL